MMGVLASRREAPLCPICRRPTTLAFRPFCSRRCADIDLSRWLGGAYRVPDDERPPLIEEES